MEETRLIQPSYEINADFPVHTKKHCMALTRSSLTGYSQRLGTGSVGTILHARTDAQGVFDHFLNFPVPYFTSP